MLRVTRQGIVLIEPNDTRVTTSPLLVSVNWLRERVKQLLGRSKYSNFDYVNEWEAVGNYVYSFARRDMEKLALGLA